MKDNTKKKAPKVHNSNPKGNYMREYDNKKVVPLSRKRKLSK